MTGYPINELITIGNINSFTEGEYLCHEGAPGGVLYIIISGRVEVTIQSVNDEQVCLGELGEGDFVCELSVFDNQPNDSTCIALTDTLCVAIGSDNVWRLLSGFPDIGQKLLARLTGRIRNLNNRIHKAQTSRQETRILPFTLEKGFKEHSDPCMKWAPAKYLIPTVNDCPVCGFQNTFQNLRMNSICCTQVLPNQRREYLGFDILWHYVWQCKSCGYSNFYLNFFNLPPVNKVAILRLVTMEKKYLDNIQPRYACDQVILSYYRAIHFNECLNPDGATLLAKLWRYLCWIYSDLEDLEMANYTREKAISNYLYVHQESHRRGQTGEATQQFAMVLAELYMERGEFASAIPFYEEAAAGDAKLIAKQARERLSQLKG